MPTGELRVIMPPSRFIFLLALACAALACSLGGAATPTAAPITATSAGQPPAELQAALAALPPGDAARRQHLFTSSQPCHVRHMDQTIGPTIPGDPPLAARASTRRPGYTPELYLYESIVRPGAFVVPGYQDNLMPRDFGQQLSPQEQADLLA